MKLILLKDVRAMCIFYCTYKVISLKDVQAMCIDKNKFIFFLTECLPSARHSAIQRRKYVMASYWIVYERWANQSKRDNHKALRWVIFEWNLPISWWILNNQENILQENIGPGSISPLSLLCHKTLTLARVEDLTWIPSEKKKGRAYLISMRKLPCLEDEPWSFPF